MPETMRIADGKKEEIPAAWYELASPEHFWYVWRLLAFLNQLKALEIDTGTPTHVLEIGCGNCQLIRQLEHHTAWIIDGVETNATCLASDWNTRGKVCVYDVNERRSVFREAYDHLVLFDVLEHIAESRSFLEAALFHLKPGGLVFINVPALGSLRSRYDDVVGHLRRYDKAMMAGELEAAGLRVIDERYWGFSAMALILIRKMLGSPRLPDREIVRRGFQPPTRLINHLLVGVATIETQILRRPIRGTSLLTVAAKA